LVLIEDIMRIGLEGKFDGRYHLKKTEVLEKMKAGLNLGHSSPIAD
jgi:hypothetical protein